MSMKDLLSKMTELQGTQASTEDVSTNKKVLTESKTEVKESKPTLKGIFNEMLSEAEQVTIQPASQKTQVIKQGQKTLGTVENPQLAQQIKQSIGKGEMTLAGDELQEDDMAEGLDPAQKQKLKSLIYAYRDATDPFGSEYDLDPSVVIDRIRQEFGDKIADTISQGPSMHFPRPGHVSGVYDPLANKFSPRVTKLGKINRQDAETMKRSIKQQHGMTESKLTEKAVSKSQQQAAGAALAAKRGDTPKSKLTGASKEMLSMSTKELEKFAKTKHKGLPVKKEKTDESSSGVRIVHNKLLGGWFIVRGPHQTPISGKFSSKEEAEKSLKQKEKPTANEAAMPTHDGDFGAGLGAGRNSKTLESKKAKPDFLDLDKDGNKKESMKKADADKQKVSIMKKTNEGNINESSPALVSRARDAAAVKYNKIDKDIRSNKISAATYADQRSALYAQRERFTDALYKKLEPQVRALGLADAESSVLKKNTFGISGDPDQRVSDPKIDYKGFVNYLRQKIKGLDKVNFNKAGESVNLLDILLGRTTEKMEISSLLFPLMKVYAERMITYQDRGIDKRKDSTMDMLRTVLSRLAADNAEKNKLNTWGISGDPDQRVSDPKIDYKGFLNFLKSNSRAAKNNSNFLNKGEKPTGIINTILGRGTDQLDKFEKVFPLMQFYANELKKTSPVASKKYTTDPNVRKYQTNEDKDKPDYIDLDKDGDKKESMKKAAADKQKVSTMKKTNEAKAKPDFLDLDKDGNKKESMKKAAADKKTGSADKDSSAGLTAAQKKLPAGLQKAVAKKKTVNEISTDLKQRARDKATDLANIAGDKNHFMAQKVRTDQANKFQAGMEKDFEKNRRNAEKDSLSPAQRRKLGMMEGANPSEAARLLGKAHAMGKDPFACKYEEGSHEARAYLDGYKEGLDECYGSGGGMGMAQDMSQDIGMMPGMDSMVSMNDAPSLRGGSDFEVDSMDDMGSFGGFDSQPDDTDMMAFEAWDRELNELLNEGKMKDLDMDLGNAKGEPALSDAKFKEKYGKTKAEMKKSLSSDSKNKTPVKEGISVSVSKGQQGSPDSVTVSAQDQEADALLSLIKQAGLGLFGGDDQQASNYGAPVSQDQVTAPQGGDVGDHDSMMSLIKKMSSGSNDYEDEESHDDSTCPGCGSSDCGCDDESDSKALVVGEDENEDQMEFEVAEANAPDSDQAETTADENAEAEEDKALAQAAQQNKTDTFNEGGDGGEASEEDEELTEWANDAGYTGSENTKDNTFEEDIDFMTRVISGGLNGPKKDQTTLPHTRVKVDESIQALNEWKKLSGI